MIELGSGQGPGPSFLSQLLAPELQAAELALRPVSRTVDSPASLPRTASPSPAPGWEKDPPFLPLPKSETWGPYQLSLLTPLRHPLHSVHHVALVTVRFSLIPSPYSAILVSATSRLGLSHFCSDQLPLVLSPHSCHSDLPKVQIQSCHSPPTPRWLPIAVTQTTRCKTQAEPFMIWCSPPSLP